MTNGDKIILDLCGGTGAWSKPYKDAGYDARVITLPDYDVTRTYFNDNIIVFNGDQKEMMVNRKDIYGILAAPPCTMFSLARTIAKEPRNLKEAMRVVIWCLNVIWNCQYGDKKLAFWALENPKARLRWFLGKPALTFNPFEYGDPIRKPTDIWGNFNTDLKKNVVELPKAQRKHSQQNSQQLPKVPDEYVRDPGMRDKRAIQRSITPPGFSQAFYKANH